MSRSDPRADSPAEAWRLTPSGGSPAGTELWLKAEVLPRGRAGGTALTRCRTLAYAGRL